MFDYTAYGLTIHSELQLPAPKLEIGTATPDTIISRGKVDRSASKIQNSNEFLVRADPREVCYFSPNLGFFLVREGREIIVDAQPGIEDRVLGQFILNLPLPMLLHQRGLLVLHASALAINGSAIAFLGHTGHGKSTTAAALHQRYYPLVTDDVLAVEIDDTVSEGVPSFTAFPSYPQQRLWPESIASLGEPPKTWYQIYPSSEKLARSIASRFCQQPLPLKRIYVLEFADCLAIEPLKPNEAFQEITSQAYPMIAVSKAMGKAAEQFQQCIKIASSVSICRLKRRRDYSLLSELIKLIEEDVSNN